MKVRHGWLMGLVLLGCSPRLEPLKLAGGKEVSATVLSRGREAYLLYCQACHGPKGEADGPAAWSMRPPPRRFGQGLFKFGGVPAGQLPTDEALLRTLRRGLHGTPMLAWDIPEVERVALVQYLKTFSLRWGEEEPGPSVALSPDPWKGRERQAIVRGEEVYHVAGVGHAGCVSCHPAYISRPALADLTFRVTGLKVSELSETLYQPPLRETEYPLEVDAKGETKVPYQSLPPDFWADSLKTVFPVGTVVEGAPMTEQGQREDLYRVIAGGIGGAAMPQWKGALPEENLWALVYYVQSLAAAQGTPAVAATRQQLKASRLKPSR